MDANKQKRGLRIFLLGFICAVFLMMDSTFASQEEYEILVLNSYHPNYTWTKEQTDSILSELKGSQLDTRIYIEHMKWKDFPNTCNLDNLYHTFKTRYSHAALDVIITTDDAAFEFALAHRKELFSNAPIVFSGINEQGKLDLIGQQTNLTGVIEPIEIEETIEMARQINPELESLYVIFDQTESGKSTYQLVNHLMKEKYPEIQLISLTNQPHRKIIEEIQEVEKDSAILITTYYTDSLGATMESENFCKLVSDLSGSKMHWK